MDGGQHDGFEFYDAKRDRWLEDKGFKVIRFWNNEVLQDIEIVIEVIAGEMGLGG